METTLTQARLEYLQGQITALQAAVRGLIYAHPDPQAAAQIVEQLLEETQASGLASASATEATLLGLDRSPARLLPTAEQLDRARTDLGPQPLSHA
jgi:hypothetical protein